MSLSSVNGLLSANHSPLAELANRTAELQELSRRIRPLIPATLRGHVHVTDLHQGTLTLSVSDAARATRARLLGPAIVAALKPVSDLAVRRVKVRVLRNPGPGSLPPPHRRSRTPVSPDAARLLRDLAGDGDEPLARALRRLASRSPR